MNKREMLGELTLDGEDAVNRELIEELLEKLAGRNGEMTYEFDDFAVSLNRGKALPPARWTLNGRVSVRSRPLRTTPPPLPHIVPRS